ELVCVGADFPDADALVDACGGEMLAIRTEGDGVDPVGRFAEGVEQLAGVRVPDLYCAVGAAGGKELTVGTEADAVDGVAVLLQRAQLASRMAIPQLDRGIVGRSRQLGFVRAQGNVQHNVLVSLGR